MSYKLCALTARLKRMGSLFSKGKPAFEKFESYVLKFFLFFLRSDASKFVDDHINGTQVVMFMKPTCPYCRKATSIIQSYAGSAVPPENIDIVDIAALSNVNEIMDYLRDTTGARTVSILIMFHCMNLGSPNFHKWKIYWRLQWNRSAPQRRSSQGEIYAALNGLNSWIHIGFDRYFDTSYCSYLWIQRTE